MDDENPRPIPDSPQPRVNSPQKRAASPQMRSTSPSEPRPATLREAPELCVGVWFGQLDESAGAAREDSAQGTDGGSRHLVSFDDDASHGSPCGGGKRDDAMSDDEYADMRSSPLSLHKRQRSSNWVRRCRISVKY
jgi:hypothetical protein